MSNDCCDYGCTGKGFNCPARECSQAKGRDIESEPWSFPIDDNTQITEEFCGVTAFVIVAAIAVISALILIFN